MFTVNDTPGASAQVAAFRQRAGLAAMDASAYYLMCLRQTVLLGALLAWGEGYRQDALGREGERRAGRRPLDGCVAAPGLASYRPQLRELASCVGRVALLEQRRCSRHRALAGLGGGGGGVFVCFA